MKSMTRLPKFLQTQKYLFMILLAALNQVAFAQDNNGYWDDRFGRPRELYEVVSATAIIDSGIYVGGFFPGKKSVARWDSKYWVPLGNGVNPPEGPGVYGGVATFAVIGNDLYVGGQFIWAGSLPANNIAKWNLITKSWSTVESNGHNGINGTVRTLVARGNKLYAGGEFTVAGGMLVNSIAVWNDSSKTWTPLGQGVEGTVRAIAVSGREIYVGGSFTSAGGKPANNIAKWDGKEWFALGSGVNPEGKPYFSTPHVNAIAILGGEVYVGGGFLKAGDVNANSIAKWNIINKNWSPLSSGNTNGVYYSSGIGNVYSLATNGRAIYVGGTFTQAGDQSANNIAKWAPDNNSWSPLGSGLKGQAFAIKTHGKNAYVGGGFTYAGDKLSDRFAIWHEPNEPPVLTPLPELAFAEDKTMYHPIRYWYPFVSDADDSDSTLNITVLSGKYVKATRYPVRYHFSAPANWFGQDTLQFIAADPSGLADTTSLVITVKSINDPVQLSDLPDSVSFKQGASAQLKIWDYADDVETPDSLLYYKFSASDPKLRWSFERLTGMLTLAAPEFHGRGHLVVTAGDGRSDVRDTIAVHVKASANLSTEVASRTASLPMAFQLWPNSPNPFNPSTTIHFDLPQAGRVKLAVYNLRGELVQTLVDGEISAGAHSVRFDGRGLASGVYFYRMEAGGVYTMTRKMVLQK